MQDFVSACGELVGGGPGAVVKAACLEKQAACSNAGSNIIVGSNTTLVFKFQRNKMFLPCSLVNIQYCGEPP